MLFDFSIFITEPYDLHGMIEAETKEGAAEIVRKAMDEAQSEVRAHEVTRLRVEVPGSGEDLYIPVAPDMSRWPDDDFTVKVWLHEDKAVEVPLKKFTVYYKRPDGSYYHEVVMAANAQAAGNDDCKWDLLTVQEEK